MKRNITELMRKLQLLLAVAFAVYPLHWILAGWRGGGSIDAVWIYSFLFVLTGAAALFVPGKLRVAYGVVVCICAVGAALALPEDRRLELLLQTGLFSGQLLWSLQIAAWDRERELPGSLISFGIASHLAGQILLLTSWAEAFPAGALRFSLYAFVMLTILSVNRRSLLEASGKSGRVPFSLSRRNILLLVGLFVLALGAALIPSAFTLLKGLFSRLMQWLLKLIENMRTPVAQTEQISESTSQTAAVLGEGRRQLELPPILETIILYIGAAVSFGALLWFVYRVGRKLFRAIAEGWSLLGKAISSASEDYVDEISDTREGEGAALRLSRTRLRRLSREDDKLPPGDRIRRRFLRLRLRHPEWTPGATAREKLPEEAASLYERARYTTHPVTEEDAQTFAQATREL